MTSTPAFEDWTAKTIEARVLEAAYTLMLCPRARGPKAFGNSMPNPTQDQRDAYAATPSRFLGRPEAAAIDRMERCWDWINALPDPHDRRLLYEWARTKCTRGQSLNALARQKDLSTRTLRREVTRICQSIAEGLNAGCEPRVDGSRRADAQFSDTRRDAANYSQHWRAANAKPRIQPTMAKSRLLQPQVSGRKD